MTLLLAHSFLISQAFLSTVNLLLSTTASKTVSNYRLKSAQICNLGTHLKRHDRGSCRPVFCDLPKCSNIEIPWAPLHFTTKLSYFKTRDCSANKMLSHPFRVKRSVSSTPLRYQCPQTQKLTSADTKKRAENILYPQEIIVRKLAFPDR